MKDIFQRTELLIGKQNLNKLNDSKVLIFGLGGVGSYVVEALARGGIGTLGIVDRDTVAYSNINRQLIALHSTAGLKKTDAAMQRLLDINPKIKIHPYFLSFDETTATEINFSDYNYIVDAIDSIKSKVEIVRRAKSAAVPVISCMGTGFKLEPNRLKITDIYSTSVCPLCKLMRKLLRGEGINNLKVLYSDEPPQIGQMPNMTNEINGDVDVCENGDGCGSEEKNIKDCESHSSIKNIASISFVPSVAGLLIAAEVIKDLIK